MAATITTTESAQASNTHSPMKHSPSLITPPKEAKPRKALVFDPSKPDDGLTEDEEADEQNKESTHFEIQLPRWRNRVHIFDEAKTRFICTLRLDRLGFVKNCRRRLGYDYKVLYVKKWVPA